MQAPKSELTELEKICILIKNHIDSIANSCVAIEF